MYIIIKALLLYFFPAYLKQVSFKLHVIPSSVLTDPGQKLSGVMNSVSNKKGLGPIAHEILFEPAKNHLYRPTGPVVITATQYTSIYKSYK